MKGLLIKDLRLASQRKKYFMGLTAVAAVMAFSTEDSFFISWIMMIFGIFSVSAMSYDEFDNCYAFLMTLPVTRKSYVREKYLFALLCACAGTAVSLLLCVLKGVINGVPVFTFDTVTYILAGIMICALIVDVNIPMTLKMGTEKGRTVLILIFGAVAAFGFLAGKVLPADSLHVSAVSGNMMTAIAIALLIFGTAFSMAFSTKIMENKEF